MEYHYDLGPEENLAETFQKLIEAQLTGKPESEGSPVQKSL